MVTKLMKEIKINGKKNNREVKDCLGRKIANWQYSFQNKLYSASYTQTQPVQDPKTSFCEGYASSSSPRTTG